MPDRVVESKPRVEVQSTSALAADGVEERPDQTKPMVSLGVLVKYSTVKVIEHCKELGPVRENPLRPTWTLLGLDPSYVTLPSGQPEPE